MSEGVEFEEMREALERSLREIPDQRTGDNAQYEMRDAALAAFSVFFMQAPSFLSYQQDMQRKRDRNNARSLFGVEKIPSDGQIRNLLDRVDAAVLREPFWEIYGLLAESGKLERYRRINGTRLISLDGSQYFSSQKIHCKNCRVTVRDGRAYYSHPVLAAVMCAPGEKRVCALEPEFITPQDGHNQQDCEQQAIKRWVERNAKHFPDWGVTLLADDLHSHQPLCELLLAHRFHFIFTCKPDAHQALYEEVKLLRELEGAVGSKTSRRWNGRHHERAVYRWAPQVPLRAVDNALAVNWCEVTIVNEESGEQIYHSAWVTDHEINAKNVIEIVADGRSRWKSENEGFNVLKNHGYKFAHNFGHGQENLSAVLLSLMLLAFLIHTVLDLTNDMYQAIRRELSTRRKFFNDLRALTRYIYFSGWQQMMRFMYQQLEIEPG